MKPSIAVSLGTLAVVSAALAADIGTPGLIILQRKKDGEPLRTANAIPGSPAAKAGIPPNGFLIAVNGSNVVSMPLTQAMNMVRGAVGTTVTLGIADSAMLQTNKFTLKRGQLIHTRDKLEVIER
jgi:C-terminal processing protease CtpA/Prc